MPGFSGGGGMWGWCGVCWVWGELEGGEDALQVPRGVSRKARLEDGKEWK